MEALVWAIVLLLLGVALLVLEVFVPSGGVLSVLAGLCTLAAVVVAFGGGMQTGLSVLIAAAVLVPLVLSAAIRLWPQSPLGRLILIPRPESQDDVLPDNAFYRGQQELIGKLGKARTPMLPSGVVVIDGKKYDSVSNGTAIDAGHVVEVVAVRTHRLIVKPSSAKLPDPAKKSPAGEQDESLEQSLESLGIEPLDDPLA